MGCIMIMILCPKYTEFLPFLLPHLPEELERGLLRFEMALLMFQRANWRCGMNTIRSLFLVFFFLLLSSPLFAQSSDLAGLQSKLTVDCKSIRGHASRIVAEAAESEFNRDVAAAHLGQVARYQAAMESDLKSTSDLLDKKQRELVNAELTSLLGTCKRVGEGVRDLEKEFKKDRPNIETLRRGAIKIRNDMNQGAAVHERLKEKLGII